MVIAPFLGSAAVGAGAGATRPGQQRTKRGHADKGRQVLLPLTRPQGGGGGGGGGNDGRDMSRGHGYLLNMLSEERGDSDGDGEEGAVGGGYRHAAGGPGLSPHHRGPGLPPITVGPRTPTREVHFAADTRTIHCGGASGGAGLGSGGLGGLWLSPAVLLQLTAADGGLALSAAQLHHLSAYAAMPTSAASGDVTRPLKPRLEIAESTSSAAPATDAEAAASRVRRRQRVDGTTSPEPGTRSPNEATSPLPGQISPNSPLPEGGGGGGGDGGGGGGDDGSAPPRKTRFHYRYHLPEVGPRRYWE